MVRLAALSGTDGTRRFLPLELAGSLRVGQLTASRWLDEAERYAAALPVTLGMLERGELLTAQAAVLLHVTSHAPQEIAAKVEAEVLPDGALLCPADLRRLVSRTLLRIEAEQDSPAAAEQRHADAAAGRHTSHRPEPDGLGLAGAVLTAEQLASWSSGLDTLEKKERICDRQAGVERTAQQRRADLFAALPAMVLAAQDGAVPGWVAGSSVEVRPQVVLNVLVPMSTVLELSREPGMMDRYGPLTAEHVRLLRPTLLRRVLIDEETGRPLHVQDRPEPASPDPIGLREQILRMNRPEVITDRAEPQHDPSAALARLVDLRDVRCAAPGCGSTRTHRDHLIPWPEGPTAAWNLGLLSARCHAAKHTDWALVRHLDGSTTWTSPSGGPTPDPARTPHHHGSTRTPNPHHDDHHPWDRHPAGSPPPIPSWHPLRRRARRSLSSRRCRSRTTNRPSSAGSTRACRTTAKRRDPGTASGAGSTATTATTATASGAKVSAIRQRPAGPPTGRRPGPPAERGSASPARR